MRSILTVTQMQLKNVRGLQQ